MTTLPNELAPLVEGPLLARKGTVERGVPVIEVDDLTVSFGRLKAAQDVSLAVKMGEVYAIVGESGCGKSTLAYSLLNIVPPPGQITGGEVRYRGRSLKTMNRRELNRLRARDVAIVFQAAMNALNPVLTVGRQVEHIIKAHPDVFASEEEGKQYFEKLLGLVRLPPERVWGTYESRLSGGMKQRVAIAVALLLGPSVLVMDEPTTALDVLSQRLVIDILRDLHHTLGMTIMFVTHDLALVAELAERVAVMYAGRLVEVGTVDEVFYAERRHPYASALIDAIPSVIGDRGLIHSIPGQVPNLLQLPPACRFEPRCPLARPICREVEPPLLSDGNGHAVACHVANEELQGAGEVVS
jgi:peptide/nickel transport system ATP-binding protein